MRLAKLEVQDVRLPAGQEKASELYRTGIRTKGMRDGQPPSIKEKEALCL